MCQQQPTCTCKAGGGYLAASPQQARPYTMQAGTEQRCSVQQTAKRQIATHKTPRQAEAWALASTDCPVLWAHRRRAGSLWQKHGPAQFTVSKLEQKQAADRNMSGPAQSKQSKASAMAMLSKKGQNTLRLSLSLMPACIAALPSRPSTHSPRAAHVMRRCCSQPTRDRCASTQLEQSPWLSDACNNTQRRVLGQRWKVTTGHVKPTPG